MSLSTGLSIAKGVMDLASGVMRARAVNSAARRNFANAQIDAAFQYSQSHREFIENDRAARQAGYDAALDARAAVASAGNSAAAGGVMGATIDALIAEELRTGARNQSRIQDQRTNNMMSNRAEGRRIQSQTQARINQTPTASFGLLDIGKIALNTALSIQSNRDRLDQVRGG